MKKHKFYFTDDTGSFNGYDRQTVWIDTDRQILNVGRSLAIPLEEVMSAEIRPVLKRPKTQYLAINVCGPTIEGGRPVTLALVHKNFFACTKTGPMQEFVDEIRPLIENKRQPVFTHGLESEQGLQRAQYALNVSLLIAYYRKLWYSFDPPASVVRKTLGLMLLAGVINVFGVLLVALPFDNYRMSRNLVKSGWSQKTAFLAYVCLTYPAYVWWAVRMFRWLAEPG